MHPMACTCGPTASTARSTISSIAGSGDRQRRRRDRAKAPAGRDRTSKTQTHGKPRRLRLLSARPGLLSPGRAAGQPSRPCRCSARRSSSIPISPPRTGCGLVLQPAAEEWLAQGSGPGANRNQAVGLAGGGDSDGEDAVALSTAGSSLAQVLQETRCRHRADRSGARAQSEPGDRVVEQRLGQKLPRRTGHRDRARRARHAPESAGSPCALHGRRHGFCPFHCRPL